MNDDEGNVVGAQEDTSKKFVSYKQALKKEKDQDIKGGADYSDDDEHKKKQKNKRNKKGGEHDEDFEEPAEKKFVGAGDSMAD